MSNLANIYAHLRRIYGEKYAITYAQAPSYLLEIVGANEDAAKKIVFLYEEDRGKSKLYNFISPSKLKIELNSDQLNLTGSPLKDDCIVDAIADVSLDLNLMSLSPWPLIEECHRGIAVEKARCIFSEPAFQRGEAARNAQGSVWILCNGQDVDKTILFQFEFARGYNTRGMITFVGVLPAYSINTQTLQHYHLTTLRVSAASAPKIDTYIENTYHIKSHIKLRCNWSTAAPMPSLIDLTTCDVTLSQTFRISECSPLTEDFMNQLRILMLIRDDIVAYKEEHEQDAYATGKEPNYRCGRGIDLDELRQSVNKVMSEISGFTELNDASGVEYDIEAVVQRAKLRRVTDLTDKLWNILKCCSSYKDLKMGFNIVFQCAAKCNLVNTPTNKNRVAEIITEVANRRLAIPCLSGSEPLELLLEVGIEKLYKDYEFIFVESKICSANELKSKRRTNDMQETEAPLNVRKSIRNAMRPETAAASTRMTLLHSNVTATVKEAAVSFKNSNFETSATAEQLAKLLQIHCTLEHLLMIQINLNLRSVYSDVCEQLLKKAPPVVSAIDDTLQDKMEITLSAHDVRELLEGKDPHVRRITFVSKNKFRQLKTTLFLSMDNICPPGIAECFQTEDKEYVKNNYYYSWLYRKIKTVCPTNSNAKA